MNYKITEKIFKEGISILEKAYNKNGFICSEKRLAQWYKMLLEDNITGNEFLKACKDMANLNPTYAHIINQIEKNKEHAKILLKNELNMLFDEIEKE